MRRYQSAGSSSFAEISGRLTLRIFQFGVTVRFTGGNATLFFRGTTSPNSPGMYQRTPRLRRKAYTALSEPRWSRFQMSRRLL